MEFTLEEVQRVTGARVLQRASLKFQGLAIDSRQCKEGQLFIALRGKRVDGHSFVRDAIERGASGALVEQWHGETGITIFVVPDTYRALTHLGQYAASRLKGKKIGITGTAGKTTCKYFFSRLLERKFSVAMTPQNFNTTLGISSSLANFDEDVSFIVVEAGISVRGEMEAISSLICPEVAVFTSFGEGHLEGLRSVEGVVEEKLKLIGEPTRRVYLNVDRRVLREQDIWARAPRAEIVSFGMAQTARLRLSSFRLDIERLVSTFTMEWDKGYLCFEIPVLAPEVALMSLPAIHFALDVGMREGEIREVLQTFRELPGRGSFFNWKNGVVIDDTYNANPLSVRKAIDLLSRFALEGCVTCLVLGDMLELGDFTEQAHRNILQHVQRSPIQRVLLFGSSLESIAQQEFQKEIEDRRFVVLASPAEGCAYLRSFITSPERWVVLLKGSRGMELETIMPEEWREYSRV